MNIGIIWKLVMKDWYLHRVAIAMMSGGILVGMALMTLPGTSMPTMGLNLLLGLFIALTFYLPLSTVLSERTEKTLPFILSLPVSPAEYTTAKIVANVGLYLIPLSAVAFGSRSMFGGEMGLAMGLSAYHGYVILLGLFMVFTLILGFSLITESMGWTVALIVVTMFVCGNVLTQLVPRIPGALQFLAEISNGGVEYAVTMGVEAGTILLLMALTYAVQVRKRNFL